MTMKTTPEYRKSMAWLRKKANKSQKRVMDRVGVKYPDDVTVGDAIRRMQRVNTRRAREKAESLGMLNRHRKPRSDRGKRRKKNAK